MLNLLIGAAILDEIDSQSETKKKYDQLPFKLRVKEDPCGHGAYNWKYCGECEKLGYKVDV